MAELELSKEDIKLVKDYQRLINKDIKYSFIFDEELDKERTMNTIKDGAYNDGKNDGEKLGEIKAKIETAKNLLKMNVNTIEQIAECTNLSVDEVTKLKEELDK